MILHHIRHILSKEGSGTRSLLRKVVLPLNSKKNFCSLADMPPLQVLKEIKVKKPDNDTSEYLGLVLSNNLKVILVSDAEADKAAASLSVGVGHLSDPRELPGLAHFCEHMLFLGTEKYPQENEYSKYLSEHSGYSNAFTADDQTNYFFEVAPNALKGALDRFSSFFYSPLFTESATSREINAVNSENDKNLQADNWRINQLRRSTMDSKHDYSKFGTGNIQTLEVIPKSKGVNVRDELLTFHSQFYSANIMSLAVVGKDPIEELKKDVVNLFSDVKDFGVQRPEWWETHPMTPEQAGQRFYVVPIKDVHSLSLQFATPDTRNEYKSAPFSYLSHLIGHEAPGSLLSDLKSRGWVNNLAAGNWTPGVGFGFFGVEMELSVEGTKHTDEIIKLFFQYVEMLKKEGPQQWVFDEESELKKIKFRFRDKDRPTDAVVSLTASMHMYPMEDAIYGSYAMEHFNADLVEKCTELLRPSNVRVDIVSKTVADKTDKKEEWYGTSYSQEIIDKNLLQEWKNCGLNDAFKMPEKNEFIPTNFSIVTSQSEQSETIPKLVTETQSEMSTLWYKADSIFKLPKAYLKWHVFSPNSYSDPRATVLTQLFSQVFLDALNEYTYNAELAGLRYSLDASFHGFGLHIYGYNDKQKVLLDKILDKLSDFKPDPQRFEVLKEAFMRSLQNFVAEQPYRHAVYYLQAVTSDTRWINAELQEALSGITLKDLQEFIPLLLSRISIEGLAFGNISQATATDLNRHLEQRLANAFGSRPLPENQRRYVREIELPGKSHYVYVEKNSVHSNNAIDFYYQLGPENTKNNMLLELMHQIIHEPAFDELRTKQQLGYIVHSSVRRSHGCQGFQVIIQSDRDCATLEDRCTEFFNKFEKDLEEMSDEQFQQHIESLAVRRLEKSKKMSEEVSKFWNEIMSRWYMFNRDEIEVDELRKIKKDEVIEFFRRHINPKTCDSAESSMRKMSVHIVSTASDNAAVEKHIEKCICEENYAKSNSKPVFINDLAEFKQSCGLYPLPKPFIPKKKLVARL